MDPHTSYNSLDRYRYLEILVGYGVGPRSLRILWTYWVRLTMVAKDTGVCPPLQGLPRCNPRKPLSLTIFIVVVDSIIQHCVELVADMEAGTEVLSTLVQDFLAYFYADEGLLALTHM